LNGIVVEKKRGVGFPLKGIPKEMVWEERK
jgi:hypothetical protein